MSEEEVSRWSLQRWTIGVRRGIEEAGDFDGAVKTANVVRAKQQIRHSPTGNAKTFRDVFKDEEEWDHLAADGRVQRLKHHCFKK